MRVIVCDDDKLFLQQFRNTLEKAFNARRQAVEIVCVESGADLFRTLGKQSADVVFLDIEMPDEDGFSVARRLSKLANKPLLVFTTSIETLVFESFEHEPIWYLLKSNMNQLPAVIDKIIHKLEHTKKYLEYLNSNTQHRVPLSDILYLESKDHYITLHTQNEIYRFRGKLSDIEKQVGKEFFIRCHASYLVNFQYVKALGKGKLLLSDNNIIPISRNKLEETQDAFMNYKGSLRL